MILLLVACTPVLKLAYGIKDPGKERTSTELVAYLERKQMATDRLLTRVDSSRQAVPEVFIFDRLGRYVPYGEPGSCNASAFDFIEQLDRTGTYTTTEEHSFSGFTAGLVQQDGSAATFAPDQADFTVFVYWARWAGRLNIDHVRVWERQAEANTKADIALYKVTFDQLDWRVPPSQGD